MSVSDYLTLLTGLLAEGQELFYFMLVVGFGLRFVRFTLHQVRGARR